MMRTQNRPYDELQHDFRRIWQFVEQDNAFRQDKFTWHLGRFGDWKYGLYTEEKLFPSFLRKNAQLWLDPLGELAGFAISEGGDSMFSIFTRQGCEFLFEEIAQWVVNNWGSRGEELLVEIHEYQKEEMKVLEAMGFQNRKQVATTRQYDLRDKAEEPVSLSPDFSIVDMATNQDYRGLQLMRNHAFRRVETITEIDVLAYEYARECPCYRGDLDLAVVAQDGRHVAACVAYVDDKNKVAEIEKVSAHSDFRRRGLTEAVIRECFHRLHRKGFEYAYLTGYGEGANALYEKLGSSRRRRWFLYALPTNDKKV